MADIFYQPKSRMFSNDGSIGAGYKFYFYQTGTTTPITTYSNSSLTTQNSNPVVADEYGYFNLIYVSDFSQVKVIVKDSSDNLIYTADPVNPSGSSSITLNDLGVRPTSYWGLTAGTASAYTLAANPTLPSYSNYNTFFIQFHVACNAAPTLNVDGLGAKNIKKYTQQGTKIALIAGDVQASQRYIGAYDGVDILILNPTVLPMQSGGASSLTIATGVVTITNDSSSYAIDTEGSSATDDLDTINGGQDGQVIFIRCANNSRFVVLKNGTGNIKVESTGNITLSSTTQIVALRYSLSASVWEVLFNSQAKDILQVQSFQTGSLATGTTTIPGDNTIPQITEGDQYMSLSITPKSLTSKLLISCQFTAGSNVAGTALMTAALFQDSTANAIASMIWRNPAANGCTNISFSHYMTSGTTSSTTFKLRIGAASAGTTTFNGEASAALMGGTIASSITITEYQQ